MIAPTAHPVYTARATSWRERFELELFDIIDAHGRVVAQAPVVDGILQIDAVVTRVPDAHEERVFFRSLAALRDARGPGRWFFLHKAPGLRLRFVLGSEPAQEINIILEHAAAWTAGWLGARTFGSFFAQPQLLEQPYRLAVETILTAAAEELVDAVTSARERTDIAAWSAFTLGFVERFTGDGWFAWEAIGRFARLRSAPLPPDAPREPRRAVALHDPRGLVARLNRYPAACGTPGFGASTALLQTLNYVFNMWAVDDVDQRAIVDRVRTLAAPELMR